MAEELRLAFILLGSLAIGAVVLHGVWTVRKAVNEERKLTKLAKAPEPDVDYELVDEEVQSLKLKQMEMDFAELQAEESGLPVVNVDVDSIYKDDNVKANVDTEEGDLGQSTEMAQVVGAEIEPQNELFQQIDTPENQSETSSIPASGYTKGTVQGDNGLESTADGSRPITNNLDNEPQLGEWHEDDNGPSIGDLSHSDIDDDNLPKVKSPAVFSHSSSDLEPTLNTKSQDISRDREPVVENPQDETKPVEAPQQVLMLFVDKVEGEEIEGARLLPLLLTLGFKFGEMDFFHRHVHNSGQGEILFSLANMFNPGTFDPDKMEQFSTRGLTIFMTLPNALEPLQTFNMMHNAAKKIADEFDAKVLDEKRRPLDVSIVRGYVERIRKFKG